VVAGPGGFGGSFSWLRPLGENDWLLTGGQARRSILCGPGGTCGAGDFSFSERELRGLVWGRENYDL